VRITEKAPISFYSGMARGFLFSSFAFIRQDLLILQLQPHDQFPQFPLPERLDQSLLLEQLLILLIFLLILHLQIQEKFLLLKHLKQSLWLEKLLLVLLLMVLLFLPILQLQTHDQFL
jgi:hypothetical protein